RDSRWGEFGLRQTAVAPRRPRPSAATKPLRDFPPRPAAGPLPDRWKSLSDRRARPEVGLECPRRRDRKAAGPRQALVGALQQRPGALSESVAALLCRSARTAAWRWNPYGARPIAREPGSAR